MNTVYEIYHEKVANQIIKELEKKRMAGSYASTKGQAKEEVIQMIPEGATVFRCGSTSLVEMGIWEAVRAIPKVTVIDPYLAGVFPGRGVGTAPQGPYGRHHDRQHQCHYLKRDPGQSGRYGKPGCRHGLWTQESHSGGGDE